MNNTLNFASWLEAVEEDDVVEVPEDPNAEKIPFDISTDDGWHDYQVWDQLRKYAGDDKFKNGWNDAATSLKYTIWAAMHGYPAGSKLVCTVGGDDRDFMTDKKKDPIISRYWKIALGLVKEGKAKLVNSPHQQGYIFGRSDMVNKLYKHINEREENYPEGWQKADDYHVKFGQLLGYSPEAINKFLLRLKAAQAAHKH